MTVNHMRNFKVIAKEPISDCLSCICCVEIDMARNPDKSHCCELLGKTMNLDEVNNKSCAECPVIFKGEKLTNADRIRSMSDEELAEFLAEHDLGLGDNNLPMPNDWLEWLQSPVDEVSETENL